MITNHAYAVRIRDSADIRRRRKKLNLGTSVKVTHLPAGITKEKLYAHFRFAGELVGDPIIHITAKSVYAHINFVEPQAAQNAVRQLNGSSIDGTSITVKLANKQATASSGQPANEACVDPENYEKRLQLDLMQWNTLMMVSPGSTTQFSEIMAPYKTNPNVVATPMYEEMCIKFVGKFDAVDDACAFLRRHLNKEISLDRCVCMMIYVHMMAAHIDIIFSL